MKIGVGDSVAFNTEGAKFTEEKGEQRRSKADSRDMRKGSMEMSYCQGTVL
jgi:hypothetical protein